MIADALFSRRGLIALGAGLIAAPAAARSGPARAALLRGGATAAGRRLAGIEIALDPGWKTYWRVAGDSGMPPRFDFSASRNVAAVEVLYPAPARMSDGFGEILGYRERVVFPVSVVPGEAGAPVLLDVAVDYGVCERLCVPLQDRLRATLAEVSPPAAEAALVASALARVPEPVEAGSAVSELAFDRATGRLSLVAALPGAVIEHVVVEGAVDRPLPLPRLEPADNGRMHASLAIDGAPPQRVLVTIVGAGRAVEARCPLDA